MEMEMMEEMEMEKEMEMERMKKKFEEFQEIMEAQKERENNGNEGRGSTSTPSYSDGTQDSAEEALISSVIEKLDDEYVSSQLCMIMNFLGGKTHAELNRLNHLIRKVMEAALNLNNIMETNGNLPFLDMGMDSIGGKLREIILRMIKSGVSDREEKKALLVLISSVIQKLEHHHAEVCKHVGEIGDLKGVIDELRMILDFLTDKCLAEVSWLDWLMCEAIEIALYLDVNVGTFYLWREATSIKSRLHGIKLRMLGSGVDGENPEAIIVLVIQQLHSQHTSYFKFMEEVGDIKGVVDELRMILDLLRAEKTVHKKYLICDLIEMALYLYEIKDKDFLYLCKEADSVQSWLREIRLLLRMLKSETETETERRLEDVGEEKGEEVDHVMVGLDEQVRIVLGRAILNEAKGLETLLITGMVGIGKTSLARQVYNHATVVDRFELRAWVRISSDLTHKDILIKLIQQVAVDSDQILRTDSSLILEEMDNRSLRHLLHQHLEGMPYLIVLDDLPRHMHLKSLLSAFPNDEGNFPIL